ncbi:hypothetical protein K8I61_05480 [bacterium]|nr:hypothetical protein [bacterium]
MLRARRGAAWRAFAVIAAATLALGLASCRRFPQNGELIDFESEDDLNRVLWTCPMAMERTPAIADRGRFALTAHLPADLYPGVEIFDLPEIWSDYGALEFTIRAPEAAGDTLHIRIDDDRTDEDFGSRYQGYRKLTGETQTIRIPMDEIRNGPRERTLDLSRIERIIVYLYRRDAPATMTLDDFRLVGGGANGSADESTAADPSNEQKG